MACGKICGVNFCVRGKFWVCGENFRCGVREMREGAGGCGKVREWTGVGGKVRQGSGGFGRLRQGSGGVGMEWGGVFGCRGARIWRMHARFRGCMVGNGLGGMFGGDFGGISNVCGGICTWQPRMRREGVRHEAWGVDLG